jgi:hypothetical protein
MDPATWATIIAAVTTAYEASVIIRAIVWIVVSTAISYLMRPKPGKGQQGVEIKLKLDPAMPRQVALGLTATGGSLVHAFTYTDDPDKPNRYLVRVIALSDYPIESVDAVTTGKNVLSFTGDYHTAFVPCDQYHNDDDVPLFYMRIYKGVLSGATASAELIGMTGSRWTSNHKGLGMAYAIVRYRYSDKHWANGELQLTFRIKGAKCYDDRKDGSKPSRSGTHRVNDPSTHEWSDNVSIVAAQTLRGFYVGGKLICGSQATDLDFDDTALTSAHNVCATTIVLQDGTEPKFRLGYLLTASEPLASALEDFQAAMDGRIIDRGGIITMWPGASRTPVYALTDADIVWSEPKTYSPTTELSQLYNYVNGTYTSSEQGWVEKPFPIQQNSTWETDDGGERLVEDVSLRAVPYYTQAQRIAQRIHKASRWQKTVSFVGPAWLWEGEDGDWFTLTSIKWGFTTKYFEIILITITADARCAIVAREVDPSVDVWYAADQVAITDEIIPGVITSPSVGTVTVAVTAIQALSAAGAEIPAMKLDFTGSGPTLIADRIEIQKRDETADINTVWDLTPVGPLTTTIVDVASLIDAHTFGYRCRACSATIQGPWSSWVSAVADATIADDTANVGGIPSATVLADLATALADSGAATSDGVWTPSEKSITILPQISAWRLEVTNFVPQCTILGLSTSAFTTAMSNLESYLTTLTTPVAYSSTAGNTNVNGTTVLTHFDTVYDTLQALKVAYNAAVNQPNPNVLYNGDFRLGSAGWTLSGWTVTLVSLPQTPSIRCQTTGAQTATSTRPITFDPGDTVTLSGQAWVKTLTGGGAKVALEIQWRNLSNDALISTSAQITWSAVQNSWSSKSSTYTVPAATNGTQVKAVVRVVTSSTTINAFVGNLKLEQAANATVGGSNTTSGALYDDGTSVESLKPAAVGATKNTVTRSASQPGSATAGDFWVDTAATPHVIKIYDGATWNQSARNTTDTNQLTDTANHAGTATWAGVSGAGKPADNATKNTVTRASSAPGSPTSGDIWVDTSTTPNVTKTYLSGAWQAAASLGGDWTGATVAAAAIANRPTELTDGRIALALQPTSGKLFPSAAKTAPTGSYVKDYLIPDTAYWTMTGWTRSTDTNVTGSGSDKLGLTAAFKTRVASGTHNGTTDIVEMANSDLYEEIEPGGVYRISARTLPKTTFRGQLRAGCTFYKKDPATGLISPVTALVGGVSGTLALVLLGQDYRTTGPSAQAIADLKGIIRAPTLGPNATFTLTSITGLNTQTVTIHGKVYTYVTTLTGGTDGEVKIGANTAEAIANLISAINLTSGLGTTYGSGTLKHQTVTASAHPSDTTKAVITANEGVSASSVTTTDTCTNGSWSSATTLADNSILLANFRMGVLWASNTGGQAAAAGEAYMALPVMREAFDYGVWNAAWFTADKTLAASATNTQLEVYVYATGKYLEVDIDLQCRPSGSARSFGIQLTVKDMANATILGPTTTKTFNAPVGTASSFTTASCKSLLSGFTAGRWVKVMATITNDAVAGNLIIAAGSSIKAQDDRTRG